MTRAHLTVGIALAALILTLARLGSVLADDETQDTEITVRATLDATDCAATPATITVLGLTIDVSTATIDAQHGTADDGSADDSSTSHHGGGGRGGNDVAPGGCYYCATPPPTPTPTAAPVAAGTSGCAALVVGKFVEVRFASDATPLVATSVEQGGGDSQESEIKAPIQSVDTTLQTITVLGLAVDVTGSGIDGSDDSDQRSEAIDLSQLMVGQFVEVKLAADTAPLVATELEVKNFSNQVEIDLRDHHGQQINDDDDDISIDVVQSVAVQATTPAGTSSGRTRKELHFHADSNGSTTLSGLPTGWAKVSVTRTQAGTTSTTRRLVRVRGDAARQLHIRLRPAHR